jgi:molybdate transport system substrate-binding protein
VSLKEAATEIGKAYEQKTSEHVQFNFAASGVLAAQIKQGAPVDLFISAGAPQTKELRDAGLLEGADTLVARNALVLIVPAAQKDSITGFERLGDPRIKRLAVGNPKLVPVGEYAMQTLAALKLTDAVKDRLIEGLNVRQVLDYVERGEVDAGIVYATDAIEAGDRVRVIATAPESSHDPIVYPAVLVKGSKNAASAAKFLEFFTSDQAQQILKSHGFTAANAAPPTTQATR